LGELWQAIRKGGKKKDERKRGGKEKEILS